MKYKSKAAQNFMCQKTTELVEMNNWFSFWKEVSQACAVFLERSELNNLTEDFEGILYHIAETCSVCH